MFRHTNLAQYFFRLLNHSWPEVWTNVGITHKPMNVLECVAARPVRSICAACQHVANRFPHLTIGVLSGRPDPAPCCTTSLETSLIDFSKVAVLGSLEAVPLKRNDDSNLACSAIFNWCGHRSWASLGYNERAKHLCIMPVKSGSCTPSLIRSTNGTRRLPVQEAELRLNSSMHKLSLGSAWVSE